MAVKGHYGSGKKSALASSTGVTHSMGKQTRSTFSKVGASAGQSSGTARSGDKSSCAPMGGKGGKSC